MPPHPPTRQISPEQTEETPKPVNHLRAQVNAKEPTIGTHILSAWPTLVALIGDAWKDDYVEFTAAYAPFTI